MFEIAYRIFVFCRIKIASSELTREILRQTLFRYFCFPNQTASALLSVCFFSDFDLRKKNVIFVWGIHHCCFQYSNSQVKCVWKDIEFRLKLGFIAFSLSIFRMTLKISSVFRLLIPSLNMLSRAPSEDHMLIYTWLYGESEWKSNWCIFFIAIGIYLKLPNKWTKESTLQDWFWRRQWIMGNKIFE